jgi:hypothetical protein
MASEWESGRLVLESFLDPPNEVERKEEQVVPTKQQAQAEEELSSSEGKGVILDSEDVADILNLPMASKASVFEAIAGVVEKNGREKSKMSRKERIEEMRAKRAKEVRVCLYPLLISPLLILSISLSLSLSLIERRKFK